MAAAPRRIGAIFHVGSLSGPALSVEPLLRVLAESGTLTVVVPDDGGRALAERYRWAPRIITRPYRPLAYPGGAAAKVRFSLGLARDTAAFLRLMRRERWDGVIVVTTVVPTALLAARLLRRPAVVYVGEIFEQPRTVGLGRRLPLLLVRRITAAAAVRICCSRAVAAQFPGSHRTVTVYPHVDAAPAERDRATARARYGLREEDTCVVALGNLAGERGQDVLIEAVDRLRERLPGVRCLIAGGPHPRPADERFAAELAERVRARGLGEIVDLLGFVADAGTLYAAADVVVNPARLNEAFGRVAAEALMAGCPVVASDVGGVPEVVRDEVTGLLVPPGDPDALATAILRMATDAELRERTVLAGRRWVEEHCEPGDGLRRMRDAVEPILRAA